MPKTTLNTLIEEELGVFPIEVQQRLIDAGLIREALSSLSIPGEPILEDDVTEENPDCPWSGRDLNVLDLDRQIAKDNISKARFTIGKIVFRLSLNEKCLKSVA